MSERAHDAYCNLLPGHSGPCLEHFCDCDFCAVNDRDRVAELVRQVETLQWALDCAGIIARAGLEVAAGVATDPEPATCPPANPLNVVPS